MIRLVGILVGLGFTLVVLLAFVTGAYTAATDDAAETADHVFHLAPKEDVSYAFEGPVGHWDIAQLQRGYKVYKEVCSACHSLNLVAFRNLAGLGYSEAQIKAEAASWQVPGIDPDTGENVSRPGEPTDYFPSPYPNDVAAKAANGGKAPPDLSLITKAREEGTHYVHSLLTGYRDPATFALSNGESLTEEFPDYEVPPGTYFNPYFPALAIGMPPPLTSAGQVTYDDGMDASIDQMATDVSAFLTWTAEPMLIKRKQTGWPVLGFLLLATLLAWFAKKQVWAPVKPRKD
ncbi:cytochrome c1 [Aurantiacibacter spongiae]|uniref:Cytochrome c1 n=1 Tax=Aurantiacibacter spongiae TaxID=2488860 RepID=A0A3N5CQH7_9SPHN|nr:cytochrome c1 [Aurantiacibacter spongiae]RPF71313.1 cytochrome c1 [Aurantiacibacter spongiae]